MGNPVEIQAVHHLCSVTMGIKANVSPCDELEAMEQRKMTKMKDGSMKEVIVSYMRCQNCGETFSFAYIEVK